MCDCGVFLATIAFYCINFYFPCCRLYSNEDARDKIIRILHVTFAGDEIIDDVLLHNAIPITLGTIQSGCIRNRMVAFSNGLRNSDSALEKLECMTPPSTICYAMTQSCTVTPDESKMVSLQSPSLPTPRPLCNALQCPARRS